MTSKLMPLLVCWMILISGCVTITERGKSSLKTRSEAHVLLGFDYLKRGQIHIANEEFDLALGIDERSDQAYHGKGLLFAQADQFDEAIEMFSMAVKLNPDNFAAVTDYSIYLCEFGKRGHANDGVQSGQTQLDKAQMSQFFTDGLSLVNKIRHDLSNTHVVSTHLGLGICKQGLGQLDEAANHFRDVLSIHNDLPQALLPLAEILFDQNQSLLARGVMERYFSTGFMSARSLMLATKIELALKDIQRAESYSEKLMSHYPNTVEARELIAVSIGG